ncbi:peptidoglycan editing factor PgeF [Maritalea porphyrae]|uniref:peptidoglycan editing factor PgeF n=1 Tax=Maritalea porphyrae TaxID=880732 RepID=UPI0022B04D53|nr:peptidoglycan editing factor PgeF [Maritalea porphyrae]MCZ4273602.1 peptidoglycan editing factor PgeF [Maritalea porphyrae]
MLNPTTNELLDIDGIGHGFFGREGGQSATPFESLNISFAVGDAPQAVNANLDEIAKHNGVAPQNLCLVKQTHSTDVVSVTAASDRQNRMEADGMVTATNGLALGIQTADCGPVLFADKKNHIIGACHAGWKGAVGGIVGNTIEAMEKLGAERQHIVAVLGPSIRVENYEVGDQFKADVLKQFAPTAPYFKFPKGAKAPHFDLPHCIMDQLESANIADISDLKVCTYQNSATFFSHRKATHLNEKTGRQLSVIALF